MIVGTITLITILFLGGAPDYFLVDKLNKGVKEYVVEKERKDELLAELKLAKKDLKGIKKESRQFVKVLNERLLDRSASDDEILAMGDSIMQNIIEMQDLLIQTRIRMIHKIEDEEWEQIISLSEEEVRKGKQKSKKMAEEGKIKDPFIKLESTINNTVSDTEIKENILDAMNVYKVQLNELSEMLKQKNVVDQPVLGNKTSTADELWSTAKEVNAIRARTMGYTMDFRSDIKENTSEKEWNKIMKEFIKLWNW